MAKSIEDQIHAAFIRQEEERCRTLEAADPSHKSVKRRVIEKPWARSGPKALCQEPDLLLLVEDYCYDLTNMTFVRYCTERGALHVAGVPHSQRWAFMADHSRKKSDFLSNPYFQLSSVERGEPHRFSPAEMEMH